MLTGITYLAKTALLAGSHTFATSTLIIIHISFREVRGQTNPNFVRLVDLWCVCSFLYSKPRTGIERIIRYFVGTELGVAHHLHRHFEWRSNILWPFEIPGFKDPKRFRVFLSEKDSVLNPERVRRYLVANGMSESRGISTAKSAAHGESIIEMGHHFDQVKKWLEDREAWTTFMMGWMTLTIYSQRVITIEGWTLIEHNIVE